MTINQWITINYQDLIQTAKNAAQQNSDWEDLLHYSLEQFLTHPKAQTLVELGHAKFFILRIMLNSSRGKKSQYYRLYRPNYIELPEGYQNIQDEEYDTNIDQLTEIINGILEDMLHGEVQDWYRAELFRLCVGQDRPNFSKLSRETGIPRTSISNAYNETIEIVKIRLKEYGHNFDYIRSILLDSVDDADELV